MGKQRRKREAAQAQVQARGSDWHDAHAPATAYQCSDDDHLIRHHVTTPMFVRMGQRDELISDGYVGSFSLPGAPAAMTLAEFAAVVRRDVAGLANLRTTAEEGAATSANAFNVLVHENGVWNFLSQAHLLMPTAKGFNVARNSAFPIYTAQAYP